MRRALHDERPASVIVFDLDRFKGINDRYGHAFGDAVLQAVAEPVRSALRPNDMLARSGGEEFTVLLVDADRDKAVQVAERIRTALKQARIEHESGVVPVTASFGVAAARQDDSLADVTARADAAMYGAKRAGRDRVMS